MDFQPSTYSIDKLVLLVQSGRIALPEFQRDFVWPPSKVVELLDSVSRGWPIGSLLMLRGPQSFQHKPLDAAPSLRGEVDLYILDGQQRLTALLHAFANLSDIVYLIDFDKLAAQQEDYVIWKKRKDHDKETPDAGSRARRALALVHEVVENDEFFRWQTHLPTERAQHFLSLRERYLSGLRSRVYRVPVVELEHEIELEALARIFETINRTGMRLNAFDLMVAVLYPHDFKLREEWESAELNHPILRDFEIDGIEILKVIAIWIRTEQTEAKQRITVKGVRQGDVLSIVPQDVKRLWSKAIDCYVQALGIVKTQFGVTGIETLPPLAMILAIAAVLGKHHNLSRATLSEWYWASVIEQTYAQGANTRVITDVDALLSGRSVSNDLTLESLRNVLLEPIRRNKILMKALHGMFNITGALDPKSGVPLREYEGGPILVRSLRSVVRGELKSDEGAPVASMIYGTELSIKELTMDFRRNERPMTPLDALRTQLVSDEDLSIDASYETRAYQIALTLLNIANGYSKEMI